MSYEKVQSSKMDFEVKCSSTVIAVIIVCAMLLVISIATGQTVMIFSPLDMFMTWVPFIGVALVVYWYLRSRKDKNNDL